MAAVAAVSATVAPALPYSISPHSPSPVEHSDHVLRLCALGHLSQAVTYAFESPLRSLHSSAFAALFHVCARHRYLRLGRFLHARMVGALPPLPPSTFVSNHLLNMYAKCGRPDLARRVFDGMPTRNLVSWTALLSGFAQYGLHDDCFCLLSAMLPYHLPNEFALAATLSSCAGARRPLRGRQVHALALKSSLDSSVFVGNALVAMYSSCDGHGDDGWLIFRTMPFRNLITWNSIIAGSQQNGQMDRSLNLFAEMRQSYIDFDKATLVSVIPSCYTIQHWQQLLCLTIKTCHDHEAEVATALLKAYWFLLGSVEDCYKLFNGIRNHDIVSWTGIMASFAEGLPEEAIFLFCRLRHEGLKPDRYTFSVAIKATAGFATENHCSAVHSLIQKSIFRNDVVLSNALIHAYARCGEISLAERVFEHMPVRDDVSWNSIIKAYAAHGRGKEALRVFRYMDAIPDSATFVGLLTACSHGGLVDEGRELFKTMSEVYGIVPHLDHYACMVDILGRAGKLQEAEGLIDKMPMKPDSVIWSALLGACRKHREVTIAKKVAQKLIELEPKNSVGYVLMSNIYSVMGSLSDACIVRKGMKEGGVKKSPGLSWMEIGNHVHEFSAGGRHHPQRKEICLELNRLAYSLKDLGYVADTKGLLHEVTEERKEEQLLYHSEKLALAFALMKSATQADVKIMKNLRICEDCHNFMKLASTYTGKKIVVRDANRFHHFFDGICSCGDYW